MLRASCVLRKTACQEVAAQASMLALDMPLRMASSSSAAVEDVEDGWRRSPVEAWHTAARSWQGLHKDLRQKLENPSPPTRIADTAMFIGELGRWGPAEGKPHGLGVLLMEDMQHLGSFRDGRADGEGVCLSRSGCMWHGRWSLNLRVGDFFCLDAKGQVWLEQYDRQGKRYARQRIRGTAEASKDIIAKAAVRCKQCGWLHHLRLG